MPLRRDHVSLKSATASDQSAFGRSSGVARILMVPPSPCTRSRSFPSFRRRRRSWLLVSVAPCRFAASGLRCRAMSWGSLNPPVSGRWRCERLSEQSWRVFAGRAVIIHASDVAIEPQKARRPRRADREDHLLGWPEPGGVVFGALPSSTRPSLRRSRPS